MKRLLILLLSLCWALTVAAQDELPQLGRSVAPRMRVLETEHRDGYACHRISYRVARGERVEAFLLVPDGGGKHPALVLLHDHGARFDIGKEKLVRPLPSAPEHIRRSAEQWSRDHFDGAWFGDSLAAAGFVVIVPDMLYWGSRSSAACRRWSQMAFGDEKADPARLKALKTEVYEGQRAVYDSLAARGVVWAEQTLREDAQAVRVLRGLASVDPERLGAAGWSMGAHRTWLLTAFCPEVKAGCALSWMTLKDGNELSASDYSMIIPAMRERCDFPDIARWLAPKPFFFLSGTEDHLFPAAAVDSCYARMHAIYGPGSALRTEFFPGGHHFSAEVQRRISEWLGSVLGKTK